MKTSSHCSDTPLEAPRPPAQGGSDSRWIQWSLLLGAGLVLIFSAVLNAPETTRVTAPLLKQPLPSMCWFNRLTGQDCPGCGLTRSFICIAHFEPVRAWSYNPAGWLLFAIVAAQIPYRMWRLWRIERGRCAWMFPAHWGSSLAILVAAALIVQWLAKLAAAP